MTIFSTNNRYEKLKDMETKTFETWFKNYFSFWFCTMTTVHMGNDSPIKEGNRIYKDHNCRLQPKPKKTGQYILRVSSENRIFKDA